MALALRNILYTYPAIIASTVFFAIISFVVSMFSSTGRSQHWCAAVWGWTLVKISGLRVRIEGADKIPPGGSFVFVANHRSYLDSPLILPNINVQFRFFAKSSVFWWPGIGFHLRRSGHMPVHYDNPRESLKSMSAAARVIQQTGVSVLLFPEAGRTMGELEPFKDGAAYVAIKAGVPVVPIGILGMLDVLPTDEWKIKPGEVVIRIGDPIPTLDLGLSDRTKLTSLLWVRVADLIGYPVPAEKRAVETAVIP